MTVSRRRVLAGSGVLAVSLTAGCGWIERDEHETIERQYDASVETVAIEHEVGSVAVTSGTAFHVHGEKQAASEDALDALSLNERRDGDQLVLETALGDGPWPTGWWRQPTFDLEVEVPASVRVDRTETASGDVEIKSVAGPLTARTDAGDIYVSDVQGAIDARTDTGDVIVRDVDAPIAARSDTGSVTVDGVVQGIRTDTGSVETTVRETAGTPSIVSDTGDVSLALASSLDATVSVTTEAGDFDAHGTGFADVESTESGGTVVVGDGSEEIEVSTDTGSVSIVTLG
ncbi:hypothetical protein GCM10028857_25270 [Salinarchaeum chitinilyticum]